MGHADRVLPGVVAVLYRVAAAPQMGSSMKLSLLLLWAAALLPATTFYVTVAGLGGETEYEQRFAAQAQEIDKLVRAGNPDAKVQTLYGAQATKAQFESALASIAKETKPGDALVLMLIGHGSFDGVE